MHISTKIPSLKTITSKIDTKKINSFVHEGLRLVSSVGIYKILNSVTKPLIKGSNPWTKFAVGIGSYFVGIAVDKIVSDKIDSQKKVVDNVIGQMHELKKFHDETGLSYFKLIKTLYKAILKKVNEMEEDTVKEETPQDPTTHKAPPQKTYSVKDTLKQREQQAAQKAEPSFPISQETMKSFESAFDNMMKGNQ